MVLTYFKRFRMEMDLTRAAGQAPELPVGYVWLGWQPALLESHAQVKYESFRGELDASVFPCLSELQGCVRLMREIVAKDGFCPGATWLIAHQGETEQFCGTIQGVIDRDGGTVQNLGVVPMHRGLGLGRALLTKAIEGFRRCGALRGRLEVTSQNTAAMNLYRSAGFRKARTVYKMRNA